MMRPIAINVARSVVCVSVCVFSTLVSCARTAEQIEMPFVGRVYSPSNTSASDSSSLEFVRYTNFVIIIEIIWVQKNIC